MHRTSRWAVEHTVGPLGLGTLVVKPLRHVVHVADLDEAESAELGPLLRHTAAAVTTVIQPEQVYVCLWSHAGGAPAHIHFVVQPVTEADKTRFGALGPDLQAAMFREGAVPGEREIELACARLRARQLDGAVAAMAPVLALPSAKRIASLAQRLGRVRAELARPHYQGSAQAQELDEQVEDFGSDTIVSALHDLPASPS